MKLPPPVQPIPAQQIRAIRPGLGGTPTGFAARLNVPAVTAISWKNGTRKPSGAALRLLAVPGITRKRSMRRNGAGR